MKPRAHIWSSQPSSQPSTDAGYFKAPLHATDAPPTPADAENTSSSMQKKWARLQRRVQTAYFRKEQATERERETPDYVSSDDDRTGERRTRQRTEQPLQQKQWSEPPPPRYKNEWRLMNAISSMHT